jgi:hypothetical protein
MRTTLEQTLAEHVAAGLGFGRRGGMVDPADFDLAPHWSGQQQVQTRWGVSWAYLLWALGYESVWVVLLSVYLAELADERDSSRLTSFFMTVGLAACVLGAP